METASGRHAPQPGKCDSRLNRLFMRPAIRAAFAKHFTRRCDFSQTSARQAGRAV
jgi:hypothetical protein